MLGTGTNTELAKTSGKITTKPADWAASVRGAEAAQSAGFVVIFPLVFASSVFVPVPSMPEWLQAFAEASPVTLTANTARSYALEPGVPSSLGGALAWIFGILAVFIPLCVWRYRRMS